jgi:hypothetical protein
VAATLASDVMRLCFLMEGRYAPYTKWFGTAFGQLASAAVIGPLLDRVLAADTWKEREEPLALAYELAARRHTDLGITSPVEERTSLFYDRPFRVIWGGRFVEALAEQIVDPEVRALMERVGWLGGIDQISDNVDLLSHPARYRASRVLYG